MKETYIRYGITQNGVAYRILFKDLKKLAQLHVNSNNTERFFLLRILQWKFAVAIHLDRSKIDLKLKYYLTLVCCEIFNTIVQQIYRFT